MFLIDNLSKFDSIFKSKSNGYIENEKIAIN